MAKTVLITGGLGFIGLTLARTLVQRGMAVRLLDNLSPQIHGVDSQPELGALLEQHDVEVMRGDVCQRRDWVLALRDVDSVVHLAAETGTGQSMYRIGDYTRTNVLGTALLLDVLANQPHGVTKLLLASSRAVFWRRPTAVKHIVDRAGQGVIRALANTLLMQKVVFDEAQD